VLYDDFSSGIISPELWARVSTEGHLQRRIVDMTG